MTRHGARLRWTGWVLEVALLVAPGVSLASEGAIETALVEREKAFARAVAAKDMDRFLEFWADDGAVFPPGAPIANGKVAIRAEWGALLSDKEASLAWTPARAEVARSGDLGYTWGTYVLTRMRDGKEDTRRTGKYLTIWRRGADGTWRVAADIGSPDPTPEPASGK